MKTRHCPLFLLAHLLVAQPATAATNTVNNLNDHDVGSLRHAIDFSAPGDTIVFASGLTGTITLTNGSLTVNRNLTIIGPGYTNLTVALWNGIISRVLTINSGTVAISGLRIHYGHLGPVAGGGGAIYSVGELTLSNCWVSGSDVVNNGSGPVGGGGVYNNGGALTVANSLFTDNYVLGLSGTAQGGAIYSTNGPVTINNSTFRGNFISGQTAQGGAIFAIGPGILALTNCTFNNNRAGGVDATDGGAISKIGPILYMDSCTFYSNTAAYYWYGNSGPPDTNTVSGGAICKTGGRLQVVNSTFSGNTVQSTNVNGALGGGICLQTVVEATLRNTIVADNYGRVSDVSGVFSSSGFNLIGRTNGSSGWAASDLTGSDAAPLNPLLGPLQNNGGLTDTLALLPGSPAIDKGVSIGATTDQRGAPRPNDSSLIPNASGGDGSDIGAYELSPTLNTSVTGSGTLDQNPILPYYHYDSTVTLTANPAPGWFFIGWSGDATSTNNPLDVVMTTNKNVTATFVPARTLTVDVYGGGSVIKTPDQPFYSPNSTVSLSSVPNVGWAFTGWSDDASGASNPLILVMNANKNVTANFVSTVPDLIVDNTNATFTGSWTTDTGTSGSGFFAQDFRYATSKSTADATATFTPNLPLTGNYDVYVWFPTINPVGRRCSDVEYLVSYNGGSEVVHVNQFDNAGGQWRIIESEKLFLQGTNEFVRLSNFSADVGRFVPADAVRWSWSSNQPPQPYVTSVSRGGGSVTLNWLAGSNQNYRVEYRTNLNESTWHALAPDVVSGGNSATNVDSTLGNASQRFYRVELLR